MVIRLEQRRSHFYVYCKGDCNGVKPGKLRVRCHKCKDQGFELNKVLNFNAISILKIINQRLLTTIF